MTSTEAHLAILKAAELFEHSIPGAVVTVRDFGPQKLSTAIRQARARIERQAQRLKEQRARRKKWVPPFIERDYEGDVREAEDAYKANPSSRNHADLYAAKEALRRRGGKRQERTNQS